jgi:hypothetical protein
MSCKLRDAGTKYVVIVANAAIHYEVTISFKMDTGLGFGILDNCSSTTTPASPHGAYFWCSNISL